MYLGSWDDGIEWEHVWVLAPDRRGSGRRSAVQAAQDTSVETRPSEALWRRVLGGRGGRIAALISLIGLSALLLALLG